MADNSNPLAEFFAVQKQDVESLSSVKGPTRVGQPDQKGPVVGPISFSGQVSQGIRAGAQQVESDIITASAIVDYLRGNDDAAEAKMERSKELEQSFSTILEPFGQFEEFLDEPTFSGFLDQSTKAITMTTPQAMFSFASAGAGLVAGFLGKQIISQGGKKYAKDMLLDLQRKKMMSNTGRGPGLTQVEEEILDTAYDGLRYASGVGRGSLPAATNRYARARAESLRLPTIGAVTGALTQGEIVGASQSFKEYDDAGYKLTAKEAKTALALGFPQAVLDVVGEAAFFAPLFKKATGDLVKNSTVRQILDKPGDLSKKDLRVLRKAAGDSTAGEFLLDLGKAGAVGFAGSAVAEGLTERAQEEILIQQRFAIDPQYKEAEARIRGIEALFMGTMAGGARGAPSGVIAEAYKMISTGGEMQQDLQNEARARITDNNLTGSIDPSKVELTDADYEGQIEAMLDPASKRALVWMPNKTRADVASILEKFPDANLIINEAAGGVLVFDENSEVSKEKRGTAFENDFTNPETFQGLFNLSALPESGDIIIRAIDSKGRTIDYEAVPADEASIEAASRNLQANNPNAEIVAETETDFFERTKPLQEELFFGEETDAELQGSRPSRFQRTLKPKAKRKPKAKAKPVKKNVPFKTFLRNNKLDPKAVGVAELRDRLDRGTFSYTKTGGMGVDQLIEAAVDAGYLREDNAGPQGQKTYTVDDIVNLVDSNATPLADQEDSFEAQYEARRLEEEGEEETTSPIQDFVQRSSPITRDLGEDRDEALADAMANNAATAEDIFAEGDSQEGVTTPTEEATDDDNDGRVFADAGDETLQTGKFVEGTLLFSVPKRAISAYESDTLKQKETPSEQEKQEFLDAIGPQVSTVNFDNVPLNLITEVMKAKKRDPSLDVGIEVQENDAGELAYNARVLSSSFDQDLNVAIQNATNPQHLRDDLRKKYASDTGLDKLPGFNVPLVATKMDAVDPNARGGSFAQQDMFDADRNPKTAAPDQLYGRKNGVSIIQLLDFIIDRDGIALNLSREAKYAQALPTLIADLEAIGRPLHYGYKGQQRNVIEFLDQAPVADGENRFDLIVAPIDVEYGPGGTVKNITEVDEGNSRVRINKNSFRQALRAPSAENPEGENITKSSPTQDIDTFFDRLDRLVGLPTTRENILEATELGVIEPTTPDLFGDAVPTSEVTFTSSRQEAILDYLSENYPEVNQPREGAMTLNEFAMDDRSRYADPASAQPEQAAGVELEYDQIDAVDVLNQTWFNNLQQRIADDVNKTPKTTTKPLKLQDATISPNVSDYFNNPDPTKKPSKSADSKNNFAYKLLEVTKSIFKYNRKLTMITPEELIQQTQQTGPGRPSVRNKTLFTYARKMQEDEKLAQYVYLPDTDEDVILIDIQRIRGFSSRVSGLYNQPREGILFADRFGEISPEENRVENADLTTAGQQRLDGVSLPVAMLALTHEMGHAVFRTELQLLFKNQRGLKFLMDAFEKERDTTTDPKAKEQYNSKYGFEEWFADKLATVLLKKIRTGETARGGDFVSGYFTRLFKKIENVYKKMRNLVFGERFSETASGFGDFETYVNKVMENGRTYQSLHDSLQGMSFGQEVQVRNVIEETIEESGKSVSRQTLESIKTKIIQKLRAKLPGQTTDKGYWSVAYLLQTSDGYLKGLGEAGKDIAKKLYSRSSSKDKFGFINARTLITNQNLNSLYDTKDENGNLVFRDGNGELNIELIAEAALQAEDDRVNTDDLPVAAKAMRKVLQDFYETYITPNNPNIRYKENFFSRHWLLSSIVNDPQKRQKLADLLAKYNPTVAKPKGFESWLAFVEAWAITDEDSDSTGNEKQSEEEDASTLSVGMAQERKKYFDKIPNHAARRGLDANGDINAEGDAGLLAPADFAIKSYIESITKKLEYEKAVTVAPTEADKAKLEELYGKNKAEVLTRLAEGETEVAGWRAMEVLLSRIEDDANREGARKAIEAQLGKVGMNMSPVMRQINSWALLGNMVTLLTFAAIASLPDLAGPILRSKDMNDKFGTIVEQLQYTIKNKKEAEQFARDLGVVTHDSIETMYINAAELGFMTEDTKRYARGFFRVTLLEQYTKFTRVFAAGMGQQYLVRLAQKAKDGDETAIRHLGELQNNLTPDEVLQWASANKEGQRRFDTEGGKKVQEALGRFVEESIVRPNAAERPVWASNPYFALVWQLKSFFYAYGKNIVGGVIREGRSKYRNDRQLSSRIMPLLIGATILLPLTAIGLELREFIKFLGRSAIGDEAGADRAFRSDKMPWGTYMFELLDRSGIYGPFGLLLPMAQAERYGDAWFLPALGPTAERFDDIFIDRTINTKDYLPFAASIF